MTTTPPPTPTSAAQDAPPRRLLRFWRWITLQNAAPETDPVRTLAVTIAAIATAVISYESLYNLARHVIHLAQVSSMLFPLAFDAVVFGSTRVWLHPRLSDGTRRYAAAVAVFTIVASVAGNAVWHITDGIKHHVSLWQMVTVIAFSSLIPLVLALVIHMGALIRSDRRKREEKDADRADRAGRKQAKPAVLPSLTADLVQLEATGTDVAAPTATVTEITAPRDRIRAVIARHLADGRTVGGRGADVSWATVDREAETTTYAKKIGPAILAELQGQVSDDGQ